METDPHLAGEFHPYLNGKLTANDVHKNSDFNVWWLGSECGHAWESTPGKRTKGEGCTHKTCVNAKISAKRKARAVEERKVYLPKHQAFDEVLAWIAVEENCFSSPRDILTEIRPDYAWRCAAAHVYRSSLHNFLAGNRCGYCSGRYPIAGVSDLATLYPEVAQLWDTEANGGAPASSSTARSSRKAHFKGSECSHRWYRVISSQVLISGSNCPRCVKSTLEEELRRELEALYPTYTFNSDWTVLKGKELDLYVPQLSIAIEFNGIFWHSESWITGRENSKWSSAYEYHEWKRSKAQAMGVSLVFVWEDDWLNRRSDVMAHLSAFIERGKVDDMLSVLSKG